jgi:PTH1 family peptidyl-tRNA hydrolase
VDRFLVAGLGNPGAAYAATRHNVGFRVVDELCRRLRCRLGEARGPVRITRAVSSGAELVLVQPLTYMNASGPAIAHHLREAEVPLDRLLVIVDDVALPLGSLRVRLQGSDGGHNGLRSVTEALGSGEFPRLRCGIRREPMPGGELLAAFVLAPFERDERDAVDTMVARAADAVLAGAAQGWTAAMNSFN